MNQQIRIIGLDPSMRNFGMAIADYSITTGKLSVTHLEIAQTEKNQDKQVRRNSDDLARAQSIVQEIKRVIALYKPTLAMAEVPVGAQNARAAFSNGLCCGLLAAVPVPIIQVTPTEVKVSAVGSKTASKDAMIQWAVGQWPVAPWMTRKLKGEIVLMADNEHLADACGAINAGILTAQFAQAVAMMESMRAA
jgi:Holliday junction resolvasome RuvABC endonuclease subunit